MTTPDQRSDAWQGMGVGWSITSTMIGGIVACGGLGFLIDRLLRTEQVFTGAGFVVGAVGAIYVIWLRYGRGEGGGD
jgi:F0F1-type ATP synthase assembly protein I